jgi:hypothetical protein
MDYSRRQILDRNCGGTNRSCRPDSIDSHHTRLPHRQDVTLDEGEEADGLSDLASARSD